MRIYKVTQGLQTIAIIRAIGIMQASEIFVKKYPHMNLSDYEISEVLFDENGFSDFW